MKNRINKLRDFYILWSTQSLSQLGSAITSFALTLWLYEKTGSALSTATLTICTYAPYVIMSIFAGALTDKFDKKKTMLVCDLMAAMTTVLVFVLYKTDLLTMWHLYAINMVSGLMNTVQQPASEVAYTLIIPKDEYQKTSGLQQLSRSLISIGNPLIAAALYGLAGLDLVIAVDLLTFAIAFAALLFFIKLPEISGNGKNDGNVLALAKEGLSFLKHNPLILCVILFMSGVNLTASAFDAVLPALVIPRAGNNALGIVTACSGIAMVIGSFLPTVLPKPKDRVRVIYLTMLFSLGIENLVLAFTRNPIIWCVAQFIGWVFVPLMAANQNVIMRNNIPVELQGRVYACRNTLQFFTIPIGLFLGGFFVDSICEPFMAFNGSNPFLTTLFGEGKGSGAALMMFILGVFGASLCLISGQFMKRYKYIE
ncbi:MFS transporter [Butyrivibrio sp. WCD2001]|uniref:MFS transporter n=1 Tax=Butyrivibrio sp. WCD2001 TaxID=1280681 RepID=UPI000404F9C2|nr:MFS transporter [Butyrivibrio sp. WCD2001]